MFLRQPLKVCFPKITSVSWTVEPVDIVFTCPLSELSRFSSILERRGYFKWFCMIIYALYFLALICLNHFYCLVYSLPHAVSKSCQIVPTSFIISVFGLYIGCTVFHLNMSINQRQFKSTVLFVKGKYTELL